MIIFHSGGYDNELIAILVRLISEKNKIIGRQEKIIQKLTKKLMETSQLKIEFNPN